MLCATLFIRVCAHEGICVSQCPFWRSSPVSKIRFFTIASVFYALNKMSTIPELCILNTFVMWLSSSAPLCLHSLLIGYWVINNSSINTLHRNRSIPVIRILKFVAQTHWTFSNIKHKSNNLYFTISCT
jgi:hypothetical protein